MAAVNAFFRADWSFRLLLLRVLVLLGLGRLTVLIFPFRKIAGWMGHEGKESPEEAATEGQEELTRLASAILAVSKYTFWKSNCFPQALCAHWILKRSRKAHTIYFGIKRDEPDKMEAHAWLRVGNRIVTGIKGHKEYTVLGKFACLP